MNRGQQEAHGLGEKEKGKRTTQLDRDQGEPCRIRVMEPKNR